MTASRIARRAKAVVAAACLVASLVAGLALADLGPYSGGPTNYFTTSDGTQIAFTVLTPKDFDPSKTYPAIFEMAGYENGSVSSSGRTVPGQTKDYVCGTDTSGACSQDPLLADDSHRGTSAFRYDGEYVSVHASVPGTGCSSGEFSLFSFASAQAGYELIEDWIVKQPWSNGKVAILGHSYSGMTGFLVAAQEGLAAMQGRPHHLVAVSVSGLIDDLYRGLTYPGGVLNNLFPPVWYAAERSFVDVMGGSGQGVFRNPDSEEGRQCAINSAQHTRSPQDDPVVKGLASMGLDNDHWRSLSMITRVGLIDVPIHITGAFQDEQTGGRGFAHLWERVSPGLPKRLVVTNGDHGTNVDPYELWSDRKAWIDYWLRGVAPDASLGWRNADGSIKPVSVRVLFELHGTSNDNAVSNGHMDSTSFPLGATHWTDHYFCSGKTLTTDRSSCGAGSDSYISGTKRQSWLYQAGYQAGPPVTTTDAGDQILLRGPVVEEGKAWAIAGPILANLYLSSTWQDTDLFVQLIDEDIAGKSAAYLQRGWLKASHRAIDATKSDYTNADPARPGFLYRPWRPHVDPSNSPLGEKIDYLVEVWPVAHVFRPGHRLAVIITSPPAVDSDYSYATPTTVPVSQNTLFYNDPAHPSQITLPVVPVSAISGLGSAGPGCPAYWQVRCVGNVSYAQSPDNPSNPGSPGGAQPPPPASGGTQQSSSTEPSGASEPAASSAGAQLPSTPTTPPTSEPPIAYPVGSTGDNGSPALRLIAITLALAAGAAQGLRLLLRPRP